MPSRAAATLCCSALLVLAGCLGGGASAYEMSEREQQLKERATGAVPAVDSYRVDGEISVSVADRGSVSGSIDGVIDRADRRAKVTVDLRGAASVEATTYIVNDTAYVNARNVWRTRDVADRNLWDRNAQLERQRELFEAAAFELRGNATVDGERVREVRLHVPEEKYDEVRELSQAGAADGEITDLTYTLYLDAETDRPRRVAVDMSMRVDGQDADASVTMTFSEFGENVSVTVPEEAETAVGASG